MRLFLLIAGILGYLNTFLMSIIHIKDKDKLEPIEVDRDAKFTPDEWRRIESDESWKRITIISPIIMWIFSFMCFILGSDPFGIDTPYGIPGFLIVFGSTLILLSVITIGRIFYRIINTQYNILNNVGTYRFM